MHIVYGITKANWGGAQAYVFSLASAAKTQGHTVSVIAGGDIGSGGGHGELSVRLDAVGIRVHTIHSLARDIGISDDVRALREITRVLRELRPDVVHLNSSKMGLLGTVAARIVRVRRIVFTAHGWPHREPRSLLWRAIAWCGSWLTVLASHRVVVVSDKDFQAAPASGIRRKLVGIHNGVGNFELLERDDARQALLAHARPLGMFSTWLLMNAELHPNKGIDIAIRALARIASKYPDLALVVCGDGEERTHLAALAHALGVEDRVFLLGFVNGARRYLRAGDCYLIPSRKEGLPMALLEAGVAGLPVIASKTGGIPDIIQDGVSGRLVAAGDDAALAAAITAIVSGSSVAAAFGAVLQRAVTQDFSEDAMVTQTIREYQGSH